MEGEICVCVELGSYVSVCICAFGTWNVCVCVCGTCVCVRNEPRVPQHSFEVAPFVAFFFVSIHSVVLAIHIVNFKLLVFQAGYPARPLHSHTNNGGSGWLPSTGCPPLFLVSLLLSYYE